MQRDTRPLDRHEGARPLSSLVRLDRYSPSEEVMWGRSDPLHVGSPAAKPAGYYDMLRRKEDQWEGLHEQYEERHSPVYMRSR